MIGLGIKDLTRVGIAMVNSRIWSKSQYDRNVRMLLEGLIELEEIKILGYYCTYHQFAEPAK